MNATKSLFLCAMCATASVIGAGCGDTNKGEGAAADAGKTDAAEAAGVTMKYGIRYKNHQVTDSGVTINTNSASITSYGLPGIPAPTADYGMLRNAVAAAEEMGVRADVGSVYTSDYFYHPDKDVNQKAKDMGLLAVEMETAGLYMTFFTVPSLVKVSGTGYAVAGPKPEADRIEIEMILKNGETNL